MGKTANLKSFFQRKSQSHGYKYRHFLNSLSQARLEEILLFSEAENLLRLIPDLKNKRTLFLNDQRHKVVLNKIRLQEPTFLLNCVVRDEQAPESSGNCLTILANADRLPVRNQHFDIIVCPYVLESNSVTGAFLDKIGRKLKNGGRIILSVRHPQLEQILYNQNPGESVSSDRLVSQYFSLLRENHLYPELLQEGIVDNMLKPFFTLAGEEEHFHEYKNTPLTLFFRAVRFLKAQP
jgi:SAM-dependent methyltransferase